MSFGIYRGNFGANENALGSKIEILYQNVNFPDCFHEQCSLGPLECVPIQNGHYFDAFGIVSNCIQKLRLSDVVLIATRILETRTVTIYNIELLIKPVIGHEGAGLKPSNCGNLRIGLDFPIPSLVDFTS
jgi:hypothetical protein